MNTRTDAPRLRTRLKLAAAALAGAALLAAAHGGAAVEDAHAHARAETGWLHWLPWGAD